MSDIVIDIDSPIYEGVVTLNIGHEGAEYIATIMEEEFQRTADAGADHIARTIRKELA